MSRNRYEFAWRQASRVADRKKINGASASKRAPFASQKKNLGPAPAHKKIQAGGYLHKHSPKTEFACPPKKNAARYIKTGCTALDDYVAAEDDAYNWVDLNITIEGPGWTAHVLNLTSQKWLTSNDWDYTVDSEGKRAGAAPVRKDLGYVDVVEKSEGCRNRGMK